MEDIRSIHLRLLHGRLGDIAYQLTHGQFSSPQPHNAWCPAINAYGYCDRIVICVDLAGVERTQIDLQVEPHRVFIRGHRSPPEPAEPEGVPLQLLALEIDDGPFEREVMLPVEVDPERVQAEQRNGLLWISLPLLTSA